MHIELGKPSPIPTFSTDLGDEFVVEVFFDERYGTMVFETLGGRSAW